MSQGVSINKVCIDFIKFLLPKGSTIIELGSGEGSTVAIGQDYKLYSVENQPEWYDKFKDYTTYINCGSKSYDTEYTKPKEFPLDKAWYEPDDLFPNLPKSYELILIDGPGGHTHGWGRGGFRKHIDKFNTDAYMVFDDINRAEESLLMVSISEYLERDYEVVDKNTGVIRGKS